MVEIPEIIGDSAIRGEAEAALRECLLDYVQSRQEEGLAIPEPEPEAAAG